MKKKLMTLAGVILAAVFMAAAPSAAARAQEAFDPYLPAGFAEFLDDFYHDRI